VATTCALIHRLRFLFFMIALAWLALIVVLMLAIDSNPLILKKEMTTQQYLHKAKSLLHLTTQQASNETSQKKIVLDAEDLAALSNLGLLKKKLEGTVDYSIHDHRLQLLASIRLPIRWISTFLNIQVTAMDAEPQAVITGTKIGSLSLPLPLVKWLLQRIFNHSSLLPYGRISDRLIKEIRILNEQLQFNLNLNQEVLDQAKDWIVDLSGKERLLVYQNKLTEVVNQVQQKRFVRLSLLMRHLFSLAKIRSESNQESIEENRALIMVLSAYVNGRTLIQWLPAPRLETRRNQLEVLLNQRADLARHLMVSAALAISGQNTLTELIGLAKELNDRHTNSGFSFIDLAADRAGARFGKTAVRSDENARWIQEKLSQTTHETLFMPQFGDLPENLGSQDFARQFKNLDSPEFLAIKQEIEHRILACELYQEAPKNQQ